MLPAPLLLLFVANEVLNELLKDKLMLDFICPFLPTAAAAL